MKKNTKQYIIIFNTLILGMIISQQSNAESYFGQNDNTWGIAHGISTGFNSNIPTNSDADDSFFGGYSDSNFTPVYVKNNTVTFTSGTANTISAAGSNGALTIVTENTLNITGGTTTNAFGGSSETGDVINNTININAGTATNIYGGYNANGGYTLTGNVIDNVVNVNGGTVTNIYGGYINTITQQYPDAETSNNSVIINNLNINEESGNIYGGYINTNLGTPGSTKANGNIVYLTGDVTATNLNTGLYISLAKAHQTNNNTLIIGKNTSFDKNITNINLKGFSTGLGWETTGSNNALEVWTKEISLSSIDNFDHLYFILPETIQNNDTILCLTNSINMENIHVGVATQSGVNLYIGDKITLIDYTVDTFDSNTQTIDMQNLPQGTIKGGSFTTDYSFDLSLTGVDNSLVATVTDKKINDEIKAPAEGQAASITLLNTSNDLITNNGLENAIQSVQQSSNNMASFGAVSGGFSKYKTGSHVNLTNASLLTGIAKKLTNNAILGLFAETGYGNYSTHNNFHNHSVRGNGTSQYYGIGIMGHYDLTKYLYTEFSGHTGYTHNYWESNDTKTPVDYDTDALYYGAHFGMGYNININKSFELNTYTKYLYAHQNGDNTKIADTRFDFENVNSHLLRLGTRLFYNMTNKTKSFIGGAWNHEFYGLSKSSTENIIIDTPSLRGDTGMFEIGIKTNNIADSAWNLDASIQSFIGKRYGFQGLINAKYTF